MKKLLRYLRKLDTIHKCLIFVFVTGLTWFFGQEVWFHWPHWERVIFSTAIVALASYWVLFGSKKNSE